MMVIFFFWILIAAWAPQVSAHELRPAYLQVRETGAERYEMLWKVPGRGESLRLGLYVEIPEGCSKSSEPRGFFADNAFVERWSMNCPGGLMGRRIHIIGLAATLTDVLVRLERLEGTAQVARLMPAEPSFVVEAAPGQMEVALTYLKLGVEHILTGIDHLLFVLALIIITGGGWKLIKTVTAFTVSHSITLTAATLGFVHIPQRPVEVIIALSIVFVAGEILQGYRGRAGITASSPWIVAFSFGLLHGLGFAGGLSEVGLPAGHIPTALLFFSAGVETGHLLFVAAVLALLRAAKDVLNKMRDSRFSIRDAGDAMQDSGYWIQSRMSHLASRIPNLESGIALVSAYAIGSVAMFWVIQRVAAF